MGSPTFVADPPGPGPVHLVDRGDGNFIFQPLCWLVSKLPELLASDIRAGLLPEYSLKESLLSFEVESIPPNTGTPPVVYRRQHPEPR